MRQRLLLAVYAAVDASPGITVKGITERLALLPETAVRDLLGQLMGHQLIIERPSAAAAPPPCLLSEPPAALPQSHCYYPSAAALPPLCLLYPILGEKP